MRGRTGYLWVDIRPELNPDGTIIDSSTTLIEGGIHVKVVPIDTSDAENGIDYKDRAGRLFVMSTLIASSRKSLLKLNKQ